MLGGMVEVKTRGAAALITDKPDIGIDGAGSIRSYPKTDTTTGLGVVFDCFSE